MKKLLIPALIIVLMSFTLVGCGNNKDNDKASTTATSSTEVSTGSSSDMMEDGSVSDGNGIIGDAEDDVEKGTEDAGDALDDAMDDISSNMEDMTLTTAD